MASVPSTVNNAVSLKHIIGELNESFSPTPNETYRGKNLKVISEFGPRRLWDPDTLFFKWFCERKSLVKTTYGSDGMTEVNVFHKRYECGVSGAFYQKEDLCYVNEELAWSEYETFRALGFPTIKKCPTVPVIYIPGESNWPGEERGSFVFNFNDTRKHALLALLLGSNCTGTSSLASEIIVEGVVPFMEGIMQSQDEIVFDNPHEYLRCEYNGELPYLMSKPQVRKLYDLGIIKMVKFDTNNEYLQKCFILSDDAFDNDPDKSLESMFGNKEVMHEYIEEMLEKTL